MEDLLHLFERFNEQIVNKFVCIFLQIERDLWFLLISYESYLSHDEMTQM